MGELIIIELGFLIGTIIFFAGLKIHDYMKQRKQQKLIDSLPPYKFINSPRFAMLLHNCHTAEKQRELFERYKDR